MSWVVYSETVRRHLTSVAYWSLLALIAIVAFGTARFNAPAMGWTTLVTLLTIVAGSAPIGPEFSSGTLQLILVKPVTRSAYLLSRVAGVVTAVGIAALFGGSVSLIARAIVGGPLQAEAIGMAVVNACVEAVLVVSLLVLFGSLTRAWFNAAIYLALQFVLSMTMAFAVLSRKLPVVVRAAEVTMNNLYPDAPRAFDGQWTLLVLSNAAVALVLACLAFRRREVPYGAD